MQNPDDDVYPPAEDSFLLMDAIDKQLPFIKANIPAYPLILEIGCGTGTVIAHLAKHFPSACVLATDVNPSALTSTKALLLHDEIDIHLVQADLFTAFAPTHVSFNIILFNPPYVPTPADELHRAIVQRDISAAWAGGINGRQVIDKFIRALPAFLSDASVAYMVALRDNSPDAIIAFANALGLYASIVHQRSAGLEYLYIIRFTSFSC